MEFYELINTTNTVFNSGQLLEKIHKYIIDFIQLFSSISVAILQIVFILHRI